MKILGIIERKRNGMRNCVKNKRYPGRDDGKTIKHTFNQIIPFTEISTTKFKIIELQKLARCIRSGWYRCPFVVKTLYYYCRSCNKVYKHCKLFDKRRMNVTYVFSECQRKTITGMSTRICAL